MGLSRLTGPSPVVLFAGAGASAALGVPTMIRMKQAFGEGLNDQQRTLWNAVVYASALRNRVVPDKVNIEHVLTYIEDCETSSYLCSRLWQRIYGLTRGEPTIEELHEFRSQLWDLRNQVLDFIQSSCSEMDPNRVVECYNPLFDLLKDIGGQSRTNVFTTNYDLAFELLVDQLPSKYELADGFESPAGAYQRTYVPDAQAEHSIILFKLHGSVSWREMPPESDVLVKLGTLSPLEIGEPVVWIYPTQHKEDTQRTWIQPFSQAYAQLEAQFAMIGAVKVLLIIGYAFGDKRLRNTISEALYLEQEAHLLVVDPSLSLEQVSRLLPSVSAERITVINAKFGPSDTLDLIRRELEALLKLNT